MPSLRRLSYALLALLCAVPVAAAPAAADPAGPGGRPMVRAAVRDCRDRQRTCQQGCRGLRGPERARCQRGCQGEGKKCLRQARGRKPPGARRANAYARRAHCRVEAKRCTLQCMRDSQQGPGRARCLQSCRATHDRCKTAALR